MTELLLRYSWPGNIRELENFIHYAVVIAEGNRVELSHLPERILLSQAPSPPSKPPTEDEVEDTIQYLQRHGSLQDFEALLQVLAACSKRQERIGRNALNARLALPMSEAQIRQKLNVLNRAGCVSVGVKKQGTQITPFGLRVLAAIKKDG